jgi:hypothetical protein
MKKAFKWALLILVAIQLVPFGHSHANPPITQEPRWDSPQTRALVRRACFDCHSNETVWPWYSNVAPFSWLNQRDVNDGRRHLNFSTWGTPQKHAGDVANQLRLDKMPLWFYLPLHPAARLTSAEKQELIEGAEMSLGLQHAQ